MRNILLLFVVFTLCCSAYGQNDMYFTPIKNDKIQQDVKAGNFDPKYEIQLVKYCLNKYRLQRRTGFILEVIGGAVCGIGISQIDKNDNSYPLVVGGSIIAFSGFITIIDSEKWLKRAYIGTDGIGIKFKF